MSKPKLQPYLLNIDEEASKRLNLQHNILKRVVNGRFLPPAVINHLKDVQRTEKGLSRDVAAAGEEEYLKIADLATGTRIWLYSIRDELVEHNLKAGLYGYDLFDNQFPPVDKREDVTLDILNILDTAKFRAIGETYHYVHARLLTSVLTVNEWGLAIENCLEILKPGGYLHFEEIPFGELGIEKNGTPVPAGIIEKLQKSFKAMNKDLDCGNGIRKQYERLGLQDISHNKIDLRNCDSEAKAMQNVNARIGFEEFITNAIARGPEALKRLGYESKEAALARLKTIGPDGETQAYFILQSILGRKSGSKFEHEIIGSKSSG